MAGLVVSLMVLAFCLWGWGRLWRYFVTGNVTVTPMEVRELERLWRMPAVIPPHEGDNT